MTNWMEGGGAVQPYGRKEVGQDAGKPLSSVEGVKTLDYSVQ